MLQGTVVTMISHFIPVCISLVHVVNVRAVVVLIQNAYCVKTNTLVFNSDFSRLTKYTNGILFGNITYHHHQYQQHRRLLLHCCLCLLGQCWLQKCSCHSCHQHHPCLRHTAQGCTLLGSCPNFIGKYCMNFMTKMGHNRKKYAFAKQTDFPRFFFFKRGLTCYIPLVIFTTCIFVAQLSKSTLRIMGNQPPHLQFWLYL